MKAERRTNWPQEKPAARGSGAFVLVITQGAASSDGSRPVLTGHDIAIVTDRLVLRPYGLGDFDKMLDLMSRPETFRFPRRDVMREEEVWNRLLRHVGSWAALGYGFFAVEERETRRFVGEAGFTRFHRNVGGGFDDAPEATWTIAPESQGRGYASEAAAAAQHWIEAQRQAPRTLCMIHPDNLPSLRIAGALGYAECGRVTYKDNPAIYFERRTC